MLRRNARHRYLVPVSIAFPFRASLTVLAALVALPICAQSTENAVAAAVLFGALAIGSVIAGLVITVLYLIKRRRWQRWVVLLFASLLLIISLWLGARPGRTKDIEFLHLLLGGTGVLFLTLGTLLRPRQAHQKPQDELRDRSLTRPLTNRP